MAKGKYARKRLDQRLIACPISESGLSTCVANLLENAGIHNMADLMRETNESLSALPGIGESAMDEIRTVKGKVKETSITKKL